MSFTAADIKAACRDYFEHYDTADLPIGEKFEVRVRGEDSRLVAILTVQADGKSGVLSWEIDYR